MKHLGTQRLITDRLILRQFVLKDAEAMYHNWANDPEVTKYLTWQPHKNAEETQQIIQSWIHAYEKPDFYQWAIALKEKPEEPFGSISVVSHDDRIQMVHIGYCIGKAWWHQGFTSEALTELVRFFFNEVGVNRVESRYNAANPNSGKVMEKAGLKFEGRKKQGDWDNHGICDCILYGLVKTDYEASHKNSAPKGQR